MGLAWWKPFIFFIFIIFSAIAMFPSGRERGRLYSASQFLGQAKHLLSVQFEEDPTDIANTQRYLKLLHYEGAMNKIDHVQSKLIKTAPNNLHSHLILAHIYADRMNHQKARYHWLHALIINPNLVEIKEQFISSCLLYQDTDSLIDYYKHLIKSNIASLDDYYNLAKIYELQKKNHMAVQIYEDILLRYPTEYKIRIYLVDALQFLNQDQEMLKHYRIMFANQYNTDIFYGEYLNLLLKHQLTKEIISITEEMLIRFPNNEHILENAANIYLEINETERAFELIKKLDQMGAQNELTLTHMYEFYYQAKDYKKTKKYMEKYHEKGYGTIDSHHLLGDIYALMGHKSASRREYETALKLTRG